MSMELKLYNTLSRKLETFTPLHPPFTGMYVCGPTVYGHAHLGHARPALTFDVVRRYLTHLGYKVRYVRNITDVGHLVNDADEGDDKIQKQARLEQLEPMEIAQFFTDSYNNDLQQLNILRPGIEPRASGHIQEQVKMIERIISEGFAYVSNGSVYFDVEAYSKKHEYGKLSGRVLEDLISGSANRVLEGQDEKRSPNDFALWKKASEGHIMRWDSPWSAGFPGWHIECSAMSSKYLGTQFDIHGGGMDLLFPHHECEIAQSVASNNTEPVKYWMHCNMITINGQKMAKSLQNGILIQELFSGGHKLLNQAYSPMTLRFFILQAHYRSTLDFSNDALLAAEKGFRRLMNAKALLDKIPAAKESTFDAAELKEKCYAAINDDFNTPVLIAHLFDGARLINSVNDGKEKVTASDLEKLKKLYHDFLFEILGLKEEKEEDGQVTGQLMQLIFELRNDAKTRKDFAASDKIREQLNAIGFQIKDGKEGTTYSRD
jgi:cysteinyl-tRNA synthetase